MNNINKMTAMLDYNEMVASMILANIRTHLEMC